MIAKRSHFIKGYVAFDVEGTIAKRAETLKYIKRQKAKNTWGTVVMAVAFMASIIIIAQGMIYGVSVCFENGWPPNLAGMFLPIIKALIVGAIFSVIGLIGYLVSSSADLRDSTWDYYDNSEIFLETEYLDMITSFVIYNEKKADLYMQYRIYDGAYETTDVFIIRGFKTRRTDKIGEPILDVDNNIYYVPYGYVN